jgi:hypothetical protein
MGDGKEVLVDEQHHLRRLSSFKEREKNMFNFVDDMVGWIKREEKAGNPWSYGICLEKDLIANLKKLEEKGYKVGMVQYIGTYGTNQNSVFIVTKK